MQGDLRGMGNADVRWELNETTLPKGTRPQLNSYDSEYKKDEETKEENIAQHGQCIQQ